MIIFLFSSTLSFFLLFSLSSLFSALCSLKREIRKLAQDECGYEEPTVAMAFVYFEKLVLQGKLNKQNRKLCAGACVLLAAKIGGDLKKHEVKLLIDVSFPTRTSRSILSSGLGPNSQSEIFGLFCIKKSCEIFILKVINKTQHDKITPKYWYDEALPAVSKDAWKWWFVFSYIPTRTSWVSSTIGAPPRPQRTLDYI